MRTLVIIPTYNERENIAPMIERVMSYPQQFEMLVVDDGSPDGTSEIVEQMQEQYKGRLHLIKRAAKSGLGTAYLIAFKWGLTRGYDYMIEMDCDFSHNPDDLVLLLASAKQGSDVVVGSRYIKGCNVVNWPLGRLIISYCASLYVRLITGMPVHDSTAGFVCYSHKVLEQINLDDVRMKGYGFQIEMKYTAWKLGFSIKEESIIFTDRKYGESKMSGGIFGEALLGVIKLRFRKFVRKS